MRFTTTPTTLCIVAFDPPSSGELVVNKRLPLMEGDTIALLSPQGASKPLNWNVDTTTGRLTVDVSDVDVEKGEYAWAFQVTYKFK